VNNENREQIIDYISFGATLSSLIMSVIAIIFTIVTSKHGNDQVGRINEATRQLQDAGTSLTNISDGLTEIIRSIDDKLNAVLSITTDTKQTFQRIIEGVNQNSQITSSGFSIENFIDSSSFLGLLALYAACLSNKKGTAFKLEKLLVPEDSFRIGYMYAYLISASCANLIQARANEGVFNVSEVNKRLERLILLSVKKYIASSTENQNINLDPFNQIRAYFDLPSLDLTGIEKEINDLNK
jgi:hypothetical protein